MINEPEYQQWHKELWLRIAFRALQGAARYLGQMYSQSDSLGWRDEGARAAFGLIVEREQLVRRELKEALKLHEQSRTA